ncbi:D-amino acid dehydrogenase small subunit [bacterium BMS3Bbin09]|nr:D-amino acid dehydrogenase small subunit [bacterium BMS3Bbin09]
MGYQEITLKLPTDYTDKLLKKKIRKDLDITDFSIQIAHKSLDARNKKKIHWLLRATVISDELKDERPAPAPSLDIPVGKRKEKALVIGSGPAGFFSAFVLQTAGIDTTIIERGSAVEKRAKGIKHFETEGIFSPVSNYAFGEGGAGTFSDGKLTSRTKRITQEKQFILSSYIEAGAPEEIAYLAHPHLGSDNLKMIIRNLRQAFLDIGGTIHFETSLQDLKISSGKVSSAITTAGAIDADYFIIAPGHSAHDTYRMLISRGVKFTTKNFAIGSRVEHRQEIINTAQWGKPAIAGLKAADYNLTANIEGNLPVFTFCMCPGGTIVPATAFENTNIVNGMSRYKRNGPYANSACVAAVNLGTLLEKEPDPIEALEWVSSLEKDFYEFAGGYKAPYSTINNFIHNKSQSGMVESSYPIGLIPADLRGMLPQGIGSSIAEGLKVFARKVKGFVEGIILGLESKTSSPVQAVREHGGRSVGIENLYIAGEGSGHAGGIISSGADGIKAAMDIISRIS